MVTANRSGPFLSAARQRAASISIAVESGPPDTARINAEVWTNGRNSASACAAETGWAASAADTLLFPLDALLQIGGSLWKLAHDFP